MKCEMFVTKGKRGKADLFENLEDVIKELKKTIDKNTYQIIIKKKD